MDEDAAAVRRARNTAYMREWRNRPENLERQRASHKRSDDRAKARDPEGFRAKARARYVKYMADPANREKQLAASRARYNAGIRSRRRGLTLQDQHDYWLWQDGKCDFCKKPYPDPLAPESTFRHIAVDHDRGHVGCKSPSIGCRECVRGQGHRDCNVAEGFVKKALASGLLTSIAGPLADYLADPPIQRWLAERRPT